MAMALNAQSPRTGGRMRGVTTNTLARNAACARSLDGFSTDGGRCPGFATRTLVAVRRFTVAGQRRIRTGLPLLDIPPIAFRYAVCLTIDNLLKKRG
jgi:hypothetical protein